MQHNNTPGMVVIVPEASVNEVDTLKGLKTSADFEHMTTMKFFWSDRRAEPRSLAGKARGPEESYNCVMGR